MLLLPDLALDVGLTRVEALRQAIAERAVAVADELAIAVTASFGVAVFDPSQQPAIAALLERADAQLYLAKKTGAQQGGQHAGLDLTETQACMTRLWLI